MVNLVKRKLEDEIMEVLKGRQKADTTKQNTIL